MIKKQDDIIYIRKRKIKHWIIVLIFLVLVLAAVKTEIRTVNVIGNDRYTAEQAESMVFNGRWDRNTLLCLNNSEGHRHLMSLHFRSRGGRKERQSHGQGQCSR